MVVTTKRRSRATLVNLESVEQARDFLAELPDKPQEDLSLREAVEAMKEPIQAAFSKGYTYQEVAAMLTQRGIKISEFTLKSYVAVGRRAAAKGKTRKLKKSESDPALTDLLEAVEADDLESAADESTETDANAEATSAKSRGKQTATGRATKNTSRTKATKSASTGARQTDS